VPNLWLRLGGDGLFYSLSVYGNFSMVEKLQTQIPFGNDKQKSQSDSTPNCGVDQGMKNAQALGLRIMGDRERLLLRGRLTGGVCGAGEDGVVAAGAREQDGQADGGQHEDDRGVGGQLGEEVRCTAGAEGRL